MKIAITSLNRKRITEHAGRCRKFWIFMIDENSIVIVPPPSDMDEANAHEAEGYECTDWYFCKKSL